MALSFEWKTATVKLAGVEAQIQQLEQTLTNLTNQIQPLINEWRHVVRANQTNNFQKTQKVTALNSALEFNHDVNETGYIVFNRNNGTRRGYLGAGQSTTNRMDMVGQEGVHIEATTGNIDLNATAGNITVNNKQIKNVASPTDPTDAVTKQYVDQSAPNVKIVEGTWNSIAPGNRTWPNIPNGVNKILDLETWFDNGTSKQWQPNTNRTVNSNSEISFDIQQVSTPQAGTNKLKAKLTYI